MDKRKNLIETTVGAIGAIKVRLKIVTAIGILGAVALGYGDGGNPTNDNEGGRQQSCEGESVHIGGKIWMTKNLNVSTIDSWCYDNDDSNCAKYGRLYTWDAAKSACPSGWRLPTRDDWNSLVSAVGNSAGTKLKAKSPDWDGTDDFGFSALPGGGRNTEGDFWYVGSFGSWWTATEADSGKAYHRNMDSGSSGVDEWNYDEGSGFSVRCVRD